MSKQKTEKKEITIEELPGVGAATAEKLREAGFDNLMSLAVASPGELVEVAAVGESVAKRIINVARNKLDMGFESGLDLLKRRENVVRLTTGCNAFDTMLAGGFETGSISETFGEFGSSKCVVKDTEVIYSNPDKIHRETFEEMYTKYKELNEEKPYENGFIVPVDTVHVLGLTERGLNQTKAPLLYREYVNKVVKLTTKRGRRIGCTKQHKLLVFRDIPTWIPAGAIRQGDLLAYPRKINMGKISSDLSSEDGYFLGFFTAEGTSNPLSITTGSNKIKNFLVNYCERRLGFTPTVRERPGKTFEKIYIILLRDVAKTILGSLVGTKAATKHIPEIVFQTSLEVIKSFIAGYLEGDGCICKTRQTISMTTKSKKLATDLSYLFSTLGIGVVLKNRKTKNYGVFYQLSIVGEDREKLNDLQLIEKAISINHVNSIYGYGKPIVKFLQKLYQETLCEKRGGLQSERENNKGTTWHTYLTRKHYEDNVMNEKTFQSCRQFFFKGLQRIQSCIDLLEHSTFTNQVFKQIYGDLPFAFNALAGTVGLTKSGIRNYVHRGIANKRGNAVKQALLGELVIRRDKLMNGLKIIKNIGYMGWDLVENIEEDNYCDYVYDFVVPEGHNFVAGNMPTYMHNSQIAHVLSVRAQLPLDKGGANGTVIFIDGESTFRPERIKQIARGVGINEEEALKGIRIARAFNSDHQMLIAEKAEDIIKEQLATDRPVRLIVVDSLTAHFRADFSGRGQLADRQQKLNKHMHTLMKLASQYNVCVYATNQVMAKPDTFFGDPTAPIGGNIVGHNSQTRIYVRKGKKGSRVAKLIDSPYLADAECAFRITENGIEEFAK